MPHIGSRYKEGLVVATWDTHKEGIFSKDDHVIKRLYVVAEQSDAHREGENFDLVGYVEVEVVSIENGTDEGYIDGPDVEVYRLPFPYDVHARKGILRIMRGESKFYAH